MFRYYLIEDKKIKKIGKESHERSFPDLIGKKLILLTLYYQNEEEGLYVSAARLNYILFDEEGKWDFLPIEKKALAVTIDDMLDFYNENDNKVTHIRLLPKLTEKQEKLLKKRLEKDFGKNAWYQVKLKMQDDRDMRKTF
ncbi:hypothetical protein [Natronospora cellulosivora (SeqCode)]